MLRRLDFSLNEIRKYLKSHTSLKQLLKLKQQYVESEIKKLQNTLSSINKYYANLEKEGILIIPQIKNIKPFEIYYIQKTGPYVKIFDYILELKSYFSKIPKNATFLTIFSANEYLPKKDCLKIAVAANKAMKPKEEGKQIIKKALIPGFKALSYKHTGSPALISLIWKQMREYKEKHKLKRNYELPFFEVEFYIKTKSNSKEEENPVSELNLPIA